MSQKIVNYSESPSSCEIMWWLLTTSRRRRRGGVNILNVECIYFIHNKLTSVYIVRLWLSVIKTSVDLRILILAISVSKVMSLSQSNHFCISMMGYSCGFSGDIRVVRWTLSIFSIYLVRYKWNRNNWVQSHTHTHARERARTCNTEFIYSFVLLCVCVCPDFRNTSPQNFKNTIPRYGTRWLSLTP